jgi:uncharacterized membrane protein (UPF0127 family)
MKPAPLFASLLVAGLFVACRSEEPAGSRPAQSVTVPIAPERAAEAPAPKSPPAAEPHPAKPSCLLPTPQTPPPKATAARSCPPDKKGNFDLPRGHLTFVDAPGNPRIEVELAKTPEHRERGLMFRTGMPEDDGMLFSWSDEQIRSFWMRNTCIPLDMLFITQDGTVAGVLEQVPTLNEDSRSVPCPVAHVLELNAGWCRSHGVVAGQHVRIEN